VAHGHRSIYGSDVHDWSLYEEQSRDLPDLRLPVDSFDHFCLLLEKDAAAINTVLNKKAPEELTLFPFGDSKHITLRVFNDINVIFGPKGTGKSCILDAIAKHYSESGIKVTVYRPVRDDRLNDIFDIKGNGLVVDLAALGIKECADEIEELRTATEVGITSLSKYVDYFSGEVTSRNAKRMRLRELSPEEALAPQREFDEFYRSHAETSGFLEFLDRDPAIAKELTSEERSEVMRILQNLGARLESRRRSTFEDWKTVELLNHAIHTFRNEVHRKTGAPAKPTTTGFRDYGLNRLRIAHSAKTVIENMNRLIRARTEAVGNLGTEKGNLEFRTEIVIQNGALTADSRLKPTRGVKKTAQQQVAKLFRKIFNAAFIRSDHLLKMINQSRADNSTERVLRSLLAPDLLIIDDFGLKGSTPNSRVTSTRSSSNGTAGPLRSSPPIAPSVAEE
jgi:ABC-type cobalamin/Fe3+-siderophores transport system ATPase subunit